MEFPDERKEHESYALETLKFSSPKNMSYQYSLYNCSLLFNSQFTSKATKTIKKLVIKCIMLTQLHKLNNSRYSEV